MSKFKVKQIGKHKIKDISDDESSDDELAQVKAKSKNKSKNKSKDRSALDDIVPLSNNPELRNYDSDEFDEENDPVIRDKKVKYTHDDVETSLLTKDAGDPTATASKLQTKQSRKYMQELPEMTKYMHAAGGVDKEYVSKIYDTNAGINLAAQTKVKVGKTSKELAKDSLDLMYTSPQQKGGAIKIKPVQLEKPPLYKRPMFQRITAAAIVLIIMIILCLILFKYIRKRINSKQNAELNIASQSQNTSQPVQQNITQDNLQQPIQQPVQVIVQPVSQPIQQPIIQQEPQQVEQQESQQTIMGGAKKSRQRDAKGRFIKSK